MIAGRYRLEHEIGRGRSTSVWAGHDTLLDRRVALKRLGFSPGSDEVDAARAEREARLAARVHHPHVVSVYDLADDGDFTWLVMELVDGPTLADLAHDGPSTSSGPPASSRRWPTRSPRPTPTGSCTAT
ncbi:protein kinase domain-containing protein [Aeromicrobium erythreum]|uniref:protein kinase domain-containing protein n=1 Tax=Aeromicrobium erythreum TaxID=2041 RepID=UPI0008342E52